MDNLLKRWLQWVERNVASMFWAAVGCALGAGLAVQLSGANPNNDFLRSYMSFVLAMLGIAIGFVVGRVNDAAGDRRKILRRARFNALRTQDIGKRLLEFHKFGRHWLDLPKREENPATQAEIDDAQRHCFVLAKQARAAAAAMPSFDEVIETEDDFKHAAKAWEAFAFARGLPDPTEYSLRAVGFNLGQHDLMAKVFGAGLHSSNAIAAAKYFADLER